jgi:hypothetical protein
MIWRFEHLLLAAQQPLAFGSASRDCSATSAGQRRISDSFAGKFLHVPATAIAIERRSLSLMQSC